MSARIDNLLSSIGSLYLAIVSVVSIYAYVGINLFEHNQAASNLIAIDRLLALRYLTYPIGNGIRDAKLNDLPNFFLSAAHEKIQELMPPPDLDEPLESELEHENQRPTESVFTDAKIEGAHVRKVPMRLAPGATCDVLVTALLPGRDFSIFELSRHHTIKSENVRLVSFDCDLGSPHFGERSVLFFSLDNGQFAFAVPEVRFPTPKSSRPFEGRAFHVFDDIQEVKKLLPDSIAKHADLNDSFVTVHMRTIESHILSYANSRLGKFFPAYQFEDAAQKLFEEKERDASYLGITASYTLLVRIGPLIYIVLSFQLWRRVRLLPTGKIRSERYWFGLDTREWIGRSYAYLSAVAPLLFAVLIYVLFSVSQDLSVVVFDRVVNLKGIFTLQFPFVFFLDSGSTDRLATAIGIIVLPLQLLISFLIVRKLIQVINTNSQKK